MAFDKLSHARHDSSRIRDKVNEERKNAAYRHSISTITTDVSGTCEHTILITVSRDVAVGCIVFEAALLV